MCSVCFFSLFGWCLYLFDLLSNFLFGVNKGFHRDRRGELKSSNVIQKLSFFISIYLTRWSLILPDPNLNKRRVLGGILSSIVGHQWATSEDQHFLSRISLELYCLLACTVQWFLWPISVESVARTCLVGRWLCDQLFIPISNPVHHHSHNNQPGSTYCVSSSLCL